MTDDMVRAVDRHGLFQLMTSPAGIATMFLIAGIGGVFMGRAGKRFGSRRGTGETEPSWRDVEGDTDPSEPKDRPRKAERSRVKDAVLFGFAILFGSTVYGGFVIGSYDGLTGFGRDVVGWIDWKQKLVPLTLDGGAAAFAFLAFRSIQREKSPYVCYAIVWAAAGASAFFNFTHGHNWQAGAYLAFLSLVGMVMFHVFLDQFETGGGFTRRKYPKFGIRWLTYTPHTLCAWLAWINHPPYPALEVTVPNAIEHLDAVRAMKRDRKRSERTEARETVEAEAELIRLRTELEQLAEAAADPRTPLPGSKGSIAIDSGSGPRTINGYGGPVPAARPPADEPQARTQPVGEENPRTVYRGSVESKRPMTTAQLAFAFGKSDRWARDVVNQVARELYQEALDAGERPSFSEIASLHNVPPITQRQIQWAQRIVHEVKASAAIDYATSGR